jgi:hypothetical protein
MEWQMNDELKGFGRKWSWLEVNHKKTCQDS